MNEHSRELGVDFGEIKEHLDGATYPITNADLLDEYGGARLELPTGVVTLEEVLRPLDGESYANEGDVQQTVLNLIDDRAIGRKYYSDRDPPALGEDHLSDDVSF